jgi:hypothetical protein
MTFLTSLRVLMSCVWGGSAAGEVAVAVAAVVVGFEGDDTAAGGGRCSVARTAAGGDGSIWAAAGVAAR